MAKKKTAKKISPAKLRETLEIVKATRKGWADFLNGVHFKMQMDDLVEKQELITSKIKDLESKRRRAPKEVVAYDKRIKLLTRDLRENENAPNVNRLKRLIQQLKKAGISAEQLQDIL